MRKRSAIHAVEAPPVDLPQRRAIPLGARVGRVVALDTGGVPMVDFPGNVKDPVPAALALAPAEAMRLSAGWQDAKVLIVFVSQDVGKPVIVGLVSDSLPEACAPALEMAERLDLRAHQEVVLQCGDAKVVLRRDGKVAISGHEIDSRAQQKHRIRGGVVAIN